MSIESFHASQQIRSGDDISFTMNTFKCFLGKIGEKYTLKEKTDNTSEDSKLLKATVNKMMKNIISYVKDVYSKVAKQESTNEENLLKLFEQYSNFTQATSD